MATKADMQEKIDLLQVRLTEARARDYLTCDIARALDAIEDRIIEIAEDARSDADAAEKRAERLEDEADNIVSSRMRIEEYL